MDQNNTKTPFLLSHTFSRSLLNNLEFGYDDDEQSLKGSISDLFVWDYSLSTNEIENYANCQKTEAWATAKIQWQDMNKMWTVVGKQSSVKIEDENRHWMCKDKNHRYYVGFSRVASFKGAMKFCSSFGGRLPTPNG